MSDWNISIFLNSSRDRFSKKWYSEYIKSYHIFNCPTFFYCSLNLKDGQCCIASLWIDNKQRSFWCLISLRNHMSGCFHFQDKPVEMCKESYSVSDVTDDVSLSYDKCKLSDFCDSGDSEPVGCFRLLIAKWRSLEGNLGVLRIITGLTSSLCTVFSEEASFVFSMWLRKYAIVSWRFLFLICISNRSCCCFCHNKRINHKRIPNELFCH